MLAISGPLLYISQKKYHSAKRRAGAQPHTSIQAMMGIQSAFPSNHLAAAGCAGSDVRAHGD
jgi:hypothetical protein